MTLDLYSVELEICNFIKIHLKTASIKKLSTNTFFN